MDVVEIKESERAVEALMPAEGRIINMQLLSPDGSMLVDCEFIQAEVGIGYLNIFFNQVKKEIKNFVDGEYGIKIGELFRGELEVPSVSELAEEGKADDFIDENKPIIDAFLKLVDIVPGFTYDVVALSLGVKRRDMEWFKDAIQEPPHRGGLTKAEYADILRVFIRQNAREIKDFFVQEAKSLVDELRLALAEEAVAQELGLSTGGRQSSTSSPATPESASTTS